MKALELAQQCEDAYEVDQRPMDKDIAAELRRLAEVNAELLVALESVRLCVKEFGIGQQIVFVDLAIAKAKEQQ